MLKELIAFAVTLSALLAVAYWGLEPARRPPPTVPQVWASSGTTYADTDSLAACDDGTGKVLLFATSKTGNRVDVFDAATGKFLQRLGSPGTGVGEFNGPNGLVMAQLPRTGGSAAAAREPLLFVIERDNARVQCFWARDQKHAGVFGEKELGKPYGGAVSYSDGGVTLYVTDAQPKDGCKVRRYAITAEGEQVAAKFLGGFVESKGAGAVTKPESIVVDDRLDRVLVCDEISNDVKVYTRDGRFTGTVFAGAQVKREPEGIVILDGLAGGVVIVTDQQPDISTWHVFDRSNFLPLGSFTGEPNVANTDGICVFDRPFGPFRGGALFAVHDDSDVRAYDLADVADLLRRSAVQSESR